MEFGISTFGEILPDRTPGNAANAYKRVQEILQLAKLADESDQQVFALGEHHRSDFVISAPDMILSAAAAITKNIRLSSAVTVLSSEDPVRVFQRFATLDLISNGRAEIMAGRGSFIESFPLFGYDLNDYEDLFVEKLDLLLKLNQSEIISWKGKLRPSLEKSGIYPRPLQDKLPVWIAVGGTPSSVMRAGNLNLPLTIAILGGAPARFKSLTDLYKQTSEEAGFNIDDLQLSINEHLYLAETSGQAREEYWPVYGKMMNKIGLERGWPPMTRQQFDALCLPEGPLLVGSPAEIIKKLIYQYGLFKNTRFLAQIIFGSELPFEKIYNSISLWGNVVAPGFHEAVK